MAAEVAAVLGQQLRRHLPTARGSREKGAVTEAAAACLSCGLTRWYQHRTAAMLRLAWGHRNALLRTAQLLQLQQQRRQPAQGKQQQLEAAAEACRLTRRYQHLSY